MKKLKYFFERIKTTKDIKSKLVIALLWKVLVILLLPFIYRATHNYIEDYKSEPIEILQPPSTQSLEHKYPVREFSPTFATLDQITNFSDIIRYIFYVDPTAYVYEEDFDLQLLSTIDLRTNLRGVVPRILITHTHSQEFFINSTDESQSIVAVGRYLAEILSTRYYVSVIHDIGIYDMVNGERMIYGAYERAEQGVRAILEKHPTIEVIIDLHRDAAPDGVRLVTEIDGRETAQIMFFNGIARRNVEGQAVELHEFFNPYIQENLALSLQMFLTANEQFPNLARRNFIKAYRYSLHIKPRSMLVEVGANTSTFEEAKNAMYPLATILMSVLSY